MNDTDKDLRVKAYEAKIEELESKANVVDDSAKAEIEELKLKARDVVSKWRDAAEEQLEDIKTEADAAVTALENKISEHTQK